MEYGASNLETGLNKTQRNDASAWLFVWGFTAVARAIDGSA